MRRTAIIAGAFNIAFLVTGVVLIAPFTGVWVAVGFGLLAIYSRPDPQ